MINKRPNDACVLDVESLEVVRDGVKQRDRAARVWQRVHLTNEETLRATLFSNLTLCQRAGGWK